MFVEGRAKSRTLDRPADGARANPADGFADGRPAYATITPTPSSTSPLRHPDESRDPGYHPQRAWLWVLTFVRMTVVWWR